MAFVDDFKVKRHQRGLDFLFDVLLNAHVGLYLVRPYDDTDLWSKKCYKANLNNHVRLIGYDNLKQTQSASMVVYRVKGF